jgi:hypothetical protein
MGALIMPAGYLKQRELPLIRLMVAGFGRQFGLNGN